MIKKQICYVCCFFFCISISHSSDFLPKDLDPSTLTSLEVLLENVRTFLSIPRQTRAEITFSNPINEMNFLYRLAKDGDAESLSNLKLKAHESPYACVLMMKYYEYKNRKEGLPFDGEYSSSSIKFITGLGLYVSALTQFEEIEDPILNASLALYHHRAKKFELAERFVQAAISQSCLGVSSIIHKKGEPLTEAIPFLVAASYGSPKGIYKLARLCIGKDKSLRDVWGIELYRHAAIRGYQKAYFALGRIYEQVRNRAVSASFFSNLIEINPDLYVHMEQKWGLGHTAFYMTEQLLARKSSLVPALLKSIYLHNRSKRNRIAHLLAMGYWLGKYGFSRSIDDAYYWLNISATEHGSLEDAYQLCCMGITNLKKKLPRKDILVLGRRLLESGEFSDKYGTLPQILVSRLLVDEAEDQKDTSYLEEASYLLLQALGCCEIDSVRRRRIVWQIPKSNVRGSFSAVEDAHLSTLETSLSFPKKQQTSYELAFHHLWGGFDGRVSLSKAIHYFFRSGSFSPQSVSFYVSVISHYLSMQRLMHSLDDIIEGEIIADFQRQELVRRQNAIATYRKIEQLLHRHSTLTKTEKELLKKEVRMFSFTNFKEAAFFFNFCFDHGMFGLSRSTEHAIHWLNLAAAEGERDAYRLLKLRYPLSLPLTEARRKALHFARTHTDGKPDVLFLGAGISNCMAAISFVKAAVEGKIQIGTLRIIEQQENSLSIASMMISRRHQGGEYSKHLKTAWQCLFGSAIWQQMYNTERMLTKVKTNDFLLAKASQESESSEDALSEDDLISHHEFLNEIYLRYLAQLVEAHKYSPECAERALFGASPIFRKLEKEELTALGLDNHFSAGVNTNERGFQPVGVGTVLELLLQSYGIQVETGYEVTGIEPLEEGGFRVEGRGQKPIFAQYVISGAGHSNTQLLGFLKKSQGSSVALTSLSSTPTPSIKRVFLRCLAFGDVSRCALPEGRSFFGLLGKHGGMVNVFGRRASVFIPGEELSYHGEYGLEENAVDSLPFAARQKLEELKENKLHIARQIFENAMTKYPFLRGAEPTGLYISTTVSENLDAIFKRTHSNARWVEGVRGYAEICATKATFGPYQALQLLGLFATDEEDELNASFTPEEMRFLQGLNHPSMFEKGSMENVVVPESFKLIPDDSFITDSQFLFAMRRYAFQRGLDFGLFEETDAGAAVAMNSKEQLSLIGQEEGITSIDLEKHILTEELASAFHPLIDRGDIELSSVKLGSLGEEFNDDEDDSVGGNVLSHLQENVHLRNLTLKGWNLTFKSRYKPLSAIVTRLQEIHLKGVTLTIKSIQALFENSVDSLSQLKKISIINSTPNQSVIKALMKSLQNCRNLEFLDLSGNAIGMGSPDKASRDLESLIKATVSLKYLFLHNNKLFESVNYYSSFSLPSELQANPFLLSVTRHPSIEEVSVTGNGPASNLLQDYFDSHFLKKFSFQNRKLARR